MQQSTNSLLSRLLDDEDDFGKDGLDSSLYFGMPGDEIDAPGNDALNGKPEDIGSHFERAFSVPMQNDFLAPFITPESASYSFLTQSFDQWNNSPSIKQINSPSTKTTTIPIESHSPGVCNLRASPRVQTLINTPPAYKKPIPNIQGKYYKSPKQSNILSTVMPKSHTVADLCKDQQGSRRIQQFLDTAQPNEIEELFEFIIKDSFELMTDLFGNYVIQKLIEYGTIEHKHQFMEIIKGHVVELSLHTYGCRVIQKACEFISGEELGIIAEEIKGHIVEFVEDQNGNHVIQKFIEFMPSTYSSLIANEISGYIISFSKHAYGCRVVQKLIERKEPLIQNVITSELKNNIWDLAVNQYGNYVIQHLLENGNQQQHNLVISEMKGKFCEYSMKKYSSNVVEKCVHCCTSAQRDNFIDEICSKKDNEMLLKLMKDPYANYVIQTLVEVMDDDQRSKFIEQNILPNVSSLRRVSYSKHLLQRLNIQVES
ncbi:pumilio family RNA-binding protein [Entamoeba histolytica HM-1:IMSS-B]|uniref:Pumilio family RNA-binding protein n=6 Tax=Entamoeba histolytica TaxID=5759 RepID=C4MB99_ENTH1|nr:pumilio family RNA-binding protein [Entamoeba histolytica HM-1:IMSS]EMD44904.1 pumilio family RNA-binding protein, putative [Entamoeba histolytica KU27]EMH74063.1 pumilio family RNA-binding protein [Entamoeba histolytica HM-1:IMSS-B]EMS17781.1 pumilio family RNA-binding protein [Entamoeba histolytica HM-3:IMSS]ENY60341.1 pumilio family RNA-binding protein, putative [Entamoeba histolytica HM-1:IMSS-A]GAT99221.1 pumilio family RNA-binding protein [Entamoeba histolytica]|eukprot:XP_653533.1 pumilio family RNA-binding protein [Entamoeba histolytica HM-1:IMSS]